MRVSFACITKVENIQDHLMVGLVVINILTLFLDLYINIVYYHRVCTVLAAHLRVSMMIPPALSTGTLQLTL